MKDTSPAVTERRIAKERLSILHQIEDWLELPMVILGFVWLFLLILEFTTDWAARFQTVGTANWIMFIIDFALKFAIAPAKLRYLRRSWLTVLALIVPAFRVFRAVRAVRALQAARGIRLLRVFSSINRGMKSLGSMLGKRGFGYAVGLSVLVTFAGGAGMYAFERDHGLKDYGSALWWTAMIVTTMGSEYWPKSAEGRILCLFLAIYAFAVFGYVTASLASFFVEKDAKPAAEKAPLQIDAILAEVQALRLELRESKTETGPAR